jgi:hypothetical protein
MPARLLICRTDMGGSGPGQYIKGDIVEVRAAGSPLGELEALRFVRVEVSNAAPAAILAFHDEYMQDLDWDVLASDLPIDGHRLLLWTTNRSASGLGDITPARATALLERWGATNIVGQARGDAAGVRFDVTVHAAATSEGFWERDDLSGVAFAELAYVQAGGVHDIRLTYPSRNAHAVVIAAVAEKAQVLADNAGARTIDFRVTRAQLLDAFKAAVKERLQTLMKRRRVYVAAAAVDQIIAAGGSVTRTLAQVQANILDRIAE